MKYILTIIIFNIICVLGLQAQESVEIEDSGWEIIYVTQMQNYKTAFNNNIIQFRAFRLNIEGRKDVDFAINKFSLKGNNTDLYYSTFKEKGTRYDGIIVFSILGKDKDQFLYYEKDGEDAEAYEIARLGRFKLEKMDKEFELVRLEYKYSFFPDDSIKSTIKYLNLSEYESLSNTYLYKEIKGIQAFLNGNYMTAFKYYKESYETGNRLKGFLKTYEEVCRKVFDLKYSICKSFYYNQKNEYSNLVDACNDIMEIKDYMSTLKIDCIGQDTRYNDSLMYMYAYSLSELHSDGSKNYKIMQILENFKQEYSFYYKALNLLGVIYMNNGDYQKAEKYFIKILESSNDETSIMAAENNLSMMKNKSNK